MVKVDGQPTEKDLEKLRNGVSIIGGKAKADVAELIENRGRERYAWVKVIISEGRNRQIRRMFEKIEFDVLKLQRVAIGGLKLGSLPRGGSKELRAKDLERIFKFGSSLER